jgi:ParB family chromosome partitioning protein
MTLQLPDLEPLDRPDVHIGGHPMLVLLDAIEEDGSQPRLDFDEESLRELANTIARVGVKQPVSVRPKPDAAGRWILNFGARRLRASKLAGKTEIPVFVDEAVDSYDQMIENEQREPLKPLEVALFIQRRLAAGDTQAEIARRLGKSGAYITYASALIDAPDWLMSLYREGRCRGVTEIYELRKLHAAREGEVERWARERDAITRRDIQEFKAAASVGGAGEVRSSSVSPPVESKAEPMCAADGRNTARPGARPTVRTIVEFDCESAVVELVLDHIADREGDVFVRNSGADSTERVVAGSALKLLRVVQR